MAAPEQHFVRGSIEQPENENLDPHHFYAAYVFDDPTSHQRDISILIDQSRQLDRPVRYWWLSEAMDRFGDLGDRLIVCVHHPSGSFDAGMDLYRAMEKHQAKWDDLEAAAVEEYLWFGKPLAGLEGIFDPEGTPVFPEPEVDAEAFFTLNAGDVQFVAETLLGRNLKRHEMQAVIERLPGYLDWIGATGAAIRDCQKAGTVGPSAKAGELADEEPSEPEPFIRQLPYSGWTEDYENAQGRFGNVVRVYEGIDEYGQLHVRRGWAIGEPPEDFRPHSWGLAFTPDGGDTLEEVLGHLKGLADQGILTPDEHLRGETFYRRMFEQNDQ